jgi:hypothetical protein
MIENNLPDSLLLYTGVGFYLSVMCIYIAGMYDIIWSADDLLHREKIVNTIFIVCISPLWVLIALYVFIKPLLTGDDDYQ